MNQRLFTIFVVLVSLIVILSTVLTLIFYHDHSVMESNKNTPYFSQQNTDQASKNSALIRKYILENNLTGIKNLIIKNELDEYIYSNNESAALIPTIVYSAMMGDTEVTKLIINSNAKVCCALRYCDMYKLKDIKKSILKLKYPSSKLKLCDLCKEFYKNKTP